mmetsp:Transcript_8126/g.21383  ORF Transcript_8126/g.21383 Transcript_8126/m.21383 type:complete len:216 (-) Transcript_8126:1482-2129(-)
MPTPVSAPDAQSEVCGEVFDLVHQRGDGEDVLRKGCAVGEHLLHEVEEARVVEQHLREHLLEHIHADGQVGERLDHVPVDALDALLPRLVEGAQQVLHRPQVDARPVGALQHHRLRLLDVRDHPAVIDAQLLLHKDRLERVEQLLKVDRVLAARAALGEDGDDQLVVVDEEGRLLLARRVQPREPLLQQPLHLGAQRAQDGRQHRLHRGRAQHAE